MDQLFRALGYSQRGPGFNTQHPHGCSQSFVTPVPGGSKTFWDQWAPTSHIICSVNIHARQPFHMHKIKFKLKKESFLQLSHLSSHLPDWEMLLPFLDSTLGRNRDSVSTTWAATGRQREAWLKAVRRANQDTGIKEAGGWGRGWSVKKGMGSHHRCVFCCCLGNWE